MVGQYSDVTRFLSYCVDITKCVLNNSHNQNLTTVVNEVVRLKRTLCGAFHYEVVWGMHF